MSDLTRASDILIKNLDQRRSRKVDITADDTISNFEEVFATNWPSEVDESIEGNFNLIYCEEEAVTQEKGDVHDVKVLDHDGESLEDQNEELQVTRNILLGKTKQKNWKMHLTILES